MGSRYWKVIVNAAEQHLLGHLVLATWNKVCPRPHLPVVCVDTRVTAPAQSTRMSSESIWDFKLYGNIALYTQHSVTVLSALGLRMCCRKQLVR